MSEEGVAKRAQPWSGVERKEHDPASIWNNVVKQDHRRIKQRIRPMLGFKRFDTAAVTMNGIEAGREDS